MKILLKYLIMGFFLTICSSCVIDKEYDDSYPVEKLYNDALEQANAGSFENSAKLFDEVERIYPYSTLAVDASILSAYSSYADEDYDSAIFKLDNFINLHPGSKYLQYAYYLRALSYYKQISVISKDQLNTIRASEEFEKILLRFPNSKYAQDAKIKIEFLKNNLAGKELYVGMFYLKRSDYLAAIKRFNIVIRDYSTTSYVPEALYRLAESYMSLGVKKQACYYAAVLGNNYPYSNWYNYSFNLLNLINKKVISECQA